MPAFVKLNFDAVESPETPAARQGNNSDAARPFETSALTLAARVAVVDDDERVCEALVFQLNSAGFKVVPYSSAEQFLGTGDANNFDCILADVFMPKMNGLALQAELRKAGNLVPIVFLTGRGDLSVGMYAMRSGASDFLEKPVNGEALLSAVKRGVERSCVERAHHARFANLEGRFKSLPPRQREVFTLITSGLLNKRVASELGISERTVKVHRERMRHKMGADSLAELSRMAEVLLIHPPRA